MPVVDMANSSTYKVENANSKGLVVNIADNSTYKIKKADNKKSVSEMTDNKHLCYFNTKFYKYDHRYVLLALIDWKEDFYKRHVW